MRRSALPFLAESTVAGSVARVIIYRRYTGNLNIGYLEVVKREGRRGREGRREAERTRGGRCARRAAGAWPGVTPAVVASRGLLVAEAPALFRHGAAPRSAVASRLGRAACGRP